MKQLVRETREYCGAAEALSDNFAKALSNLLQGVMQAEGGVIGDYNESNGRNDGMYYETETRRYTLSRGSAQVQITRFEQGEIDKMRTSAEAWITFAVQSELETRLEETCKRVLGEHAFQERERHALQGQI
ncbi:hypothetical protein HYZ97_05140 [Candidatus Pacearchaeota archaeon]|nr:hypothetical protein [Candidatus Pacearchaeota archaeon]